VEGASSETGVREVGVWYFVGELRPPQGELFSSNSTFRRLTALIEEETLTHINMNWLLKYLIAYF
jgi:hypothetical protein